MRTRRVRGKALLVMVLALALALAAGCSGGGGAAALSGVEKPTRTSPWFRPSIRRAGFFVALYQGLFKAQGLNVNFIL